MRRSSRLGPVQQAAKTVSVSSIPARRSLGPIFKKVPNEATMNREMKRIKLEVIEESISEEAQNPLPAPVPSRVAAAEDTTESEGCSTIRCESSVPTSRESSPRQQDTTTPAHLLSLQAIELNPDRPRRIRTQTKLFSREQAREQLIGIKRKRTTTAPNTNAIDTKSASDVGAPIQSTIPFPRRKRNETDFILDNVKSAQQSSAKNSVRALPESAPINVDLTDSRRNYATLTQLLRNVELILITLADKSKVLAFQSAMHKLMPINVNRYKEIIQLIDSKLLDKRQRQRLESQLFVLGPNCSVDPAAIIKSSRDSNQFRCSLNKCGKTSCLALVCQHCGAVPKTTTAGSEWPQLACVPNAHIDWRQIIDHQARLMQYPTEPVDKKRGAKSARKSLEPELKVTARKAGKCNDPLSEDECESQNATSQPGEAESAVANSTKQSKGPPLPQPSQAELIALREQSTLRAIAYIRRALLRGREADFRNSGGDIIFLLRNAIFKGTGNVRRLADECVRRMMERWDKLEDIVVEEYTDFGELLVATECLHAKQEMHYDKYWPTIERQIELTRISLTNKCCEDMLRFDVAQHAQVSMLPVNSKLEYCFTCGQFARENGHAAYCEHPKCLDRKIPLQPSTAFDSLCEAVVWTSIFRRLGISPMQLTDNSARLEDCLSLVRPARPYKSQSVLGKELFQQQCYYITHLLFILSEWGGVNLSRQEASPHCHLFIEELSFLHANMDVVIRNKDPELVGEFLQSLWILGVKDSDQQMVKGHAYLLQSEKASASMNGCWVASSQDFRTKYHAAYCGVIGLAPFEYTKGKAMETELIQYFN